MSQVIQTFKEPKPNRFTVNTGFSFEGSLVESAELCDVRTLPSTPAALRHGLAVAKRLMEHSSLLRQVLGLDKPVPTPTPEKAVNAPVTLAKANESVMSAALFWLEQQGAQTREIAGRGGASAVQWLLNGQVLAQVTWANPAQAASALGVPATEGGKPYVQAMGLAKDFEEVKDALDGLRLPSAQAGQGRSEVER